jgi:hypothetical protein
MPVPEAVPKNLTAAGAIVLAGTVGNDVMVLVSVLLEQVRGTVPTQFAVTPVIVEAVVGSVLPPAKVVKVVDVMVKFQPLPLPVRSLAAIGIV